MLTYWVHQEVVSYYYKPAFLVLDPTEVSVILKAHSFYANHKYKADIFTRDIQMGRFGGFGKIFTWVSNMRPVVPGSILKTINACCNGLQSRMMNLLREVISVLIFLKQKLCVLLYFSMCKCRMAILSNVREERRMRERLRALLVVTWRKDNL